ncbi:MAG: PHP domain-containing protein [Sedimentisphaeraceae bacterium JB056]
MNDIKTLETKLDSLDYATRKQAFDKLASMIADGTIEVEAPTKETNVHFHTFFSYNGEGYSPMKIAYMAKKQGLGSVGIVDFDVLDAVDEFYEAAAALGLKASAGMETRVFIPEFADKVINSPGEPGISYHMGTGFPCGKVPASAQPLLCSLKQTAQDRNKAMVDRVNTYLEEVALDYEEDVMPLTPSGNATERHLCLAYAQKAESVFGDGSELADYWVGKLGESAKDTELPCGASLQALIRSKTMKKGGVGYAKPDAGSFPKMAEVNEFIIDAGGIPTLTWLDGTNDGEKCIRELIDIAKQSGTAVINIIPDRNFTAGLGEDDLKCKNLYEIIEIAGELGMPVIAGTEMNSPGLKFVDDFKSKELSPLIEPFWCGAMIVYAHSVLMRNAGIGYIGKWAEQKFDDINAKNEFFVELGELLTPEKETLLKDIASDVSPEQIIDVLSN